MAIGRYTNDPRINLGTQLGTSNAVAQLRRAIKAGRLPIVKTIVVTGAERLDSLAGNIYGDARYWWILAAASDVGWGLQVPPDTTINVVKITDVMTYLS